MIVTRPLKRLPTYLSHIGSGPNIVQNKVLKKMKFWKIFFFFFFWNEVSFWGIVTRPSKRLPTYLSHRGSSPDVVWKKVLKKKNEVLKNLLKNEFSEMSLFFFFSFESNLLRMRFFEILSFSNEQKVILLTTSLTNHNAQLLTRYHWLERIWNH